MASSLDLDRLSGTRPVDVTLLAAASFDEGWVRDPHRHDYHELIWLRSGAGEHVVDGVTEPVRPGTLTVIGRGQVHQFCRAADMHGAIVRFADELPSAAPGRIVPGWLLTGRGARAVPVPPEAREGLDAAILALYQESARPPDAYAADVEARLVSLILLWLERWYDAGHRDGGAADADLQLLRRFTAVLERDFAAHHDVAHYAGELGVPTAALSRALSRVSGQATKDLILDRIMLEARRLLRFSDRPVGAIAFQVGYADQLYFSRAFKRRVGRSPLEFRRTARGL